MIITFDRLTIILTKTIITKILIFISTNGFELLTAYDIFNNFRKSKKSINFDNLKLQHSTKVI